MEFLWVTHALILMPIKIGATFQNKLRPNIYPDYFIDFNCPASRRLTKKTIRIGAGESVMYNTNPDGADK